MMADSNPGDGSKGREIAGAGDTPLLGIRHPTRKAGSVTLGVAAQRIGFAPEEISRLQRLYEKPDSTKELGEKFYPAGEEKCD